jgi:hypothetical protein
MSEDAAADGEEADGSKAGDVSIDDRGVVTENPSETDGFAFSGFTPCGLRARIAWRTACPHALHKATFLLARLLRIHTSWPLGIGFAHLVHMFTENLQDLVILDAMRLPLRSRFVS